MEDEKYLGLIIDAYEHLYDLVHLRDHELLTALPALGKLPAKARARALQRKLVFALDEMDPGPQAPVYSNEMRRHRLMLLRYERGLSPQEIADQLMISRRHYYRIHSSAIEVAAKVLRRLSQSECLIDDDVPQEEVNRDDARLELLRLEAARVAQANRYTTIGGVLDGVIQLLRDILEAHRLQVVAQVSPTLPNTSADRSLLRQTLLATLGYLVEQSQDAELRLVADEEAAGIRLSARIHPPNNVKLLPGELLADALTNIEELSTLTGAQVFPVYSGITITGFDFKLPVAQRSVLVVDDNKDVLALFRQYLSPQHYRVLTAHTAAEALDIAFQQQPFAITLDLMMPEMDGWDLLQALLNSPETENIPVIVCTVLKQKDLALSLGATSFLEKPVSEDDLLLALEAIV
jgi:CheY-like chemotaxis protein